ncbi:MAG: carboxypeptidase M32, partial [Chloroflexota bacterium]
MSEKFTSLLDKVYELHDLEKAAHVLMWDREVNMPTGGMEARTQQLTTLTKMHHTLSTSTEYGDTLDAAAEETQAADYNSFEASLIRYLQRDYDINTKLPTEFVTRVTTISAGALTAWKQARETDDFAHFEPHLAQVIELAQEMADLYGYDDEKYDALLDKFEPDMKTAEVRAVFDAVKDKTVPLLQQIQEAGRPVDDSCLHRDYPVDRQKRLAPKMAEAVGYNFECGHLGTATHPFAVSFSNGDARITTRWYPDFISPSLFGTLHESGHAMYEQGTADALARTPLARGTSMGIHESQSRMLENVVGRSLGFWQKHYPQLQETFPENLSDVSVSEFYRAINKVQPSFIRVEADELTYNLHIILRFELEQAMLNGDVTAKELPTAWNDKMQTLLGVVPPDDTQGCLQDIHWTRPGFGYFPTYALGNFYAAQLYEAASMQDEGISQ